MVIVAIFIIGLTMGYQTTKPCDDLCFARKIQQESKKTQKANPDDNSWRHRRHHVERFDR